MRCESGPAGKYCIGNWNDHWHTLPEIEPLKLRESARAPPGKDSRNETERRGFKKPKQALWLKKCEFGVLLVTEHSIEIDTAQEQFILSATPEFRLLTGMTGQILKSDR